MSRIRVPRGSARAKVASSAPDPEMTAPINPEMQRNPISRKIYQDINNELAAKFLDKVLFKGGVATLGTGMGAYLGGELWNSVVGSDWDLNAGDLARAATFLGAMGYTGARGLDAVLRGPMKMQRYGSINLGREAPIPGIRFGYDYPRNVPIAEPNVMPSVPMPA